MFYLLTTALHDTCTAVFQDSLPYVSKSRQKNPSLDLVVRYQDKCQPNTQLVMFLQVLLGPKSYLCNIQKSTFGCHVLFFVRGDEQEAGNWIFPDSIPYCTFLKGRLEF